MFSHIRPANVSTGIRFALVKPSPVPAQFRCRHTQTCNTRVFVRNRITLGAQLEEVQDSRDQIVKSESALRALPLWAGGVGGATLLVNRALSGVAPVADASSAQSRADVICLGLSACLVLTGLSWLSVQTRPPQTVTLYGEDRFFLDPQLPQEAKAELTWCWDAIKGATTCGAVLVVHKGKRHMQAGITPAKAQLSAEAPPLGPICERCMDTGKGNYLANLALFPGRVEFESFFPMNTQGILVQPIGDSGVLVVASNTVRGISPVDQAWIGELADKLEVTFETL